MDYPFEASNGVQFNRFGMCTDFVSSVERIHEARIEFYRALEDERLGRWRPYGRKDVWVIPSSEDADRVLVFSEKLCAWHSHSRGSVFGWGSKLALEYFAAHPEPKPWYDAEPGEIWVLTYGGQPTAHVFSDRWAGAGFVFISDRAIVQPDDPDITDGTRIWPEKSS